MKGLFEKKDKLLFSFVTNRVKMLCFVEPGQRIVFVRTALTAGFTSAIQDCAESLRTEHQ